MGEFNESVPPAVIVRGHDDWRLGVLGLSANRLVEKYGRPTLLWTRNHDGVIKGSIRSDGTVDVKELMEEVGGDDYFLDFGGHPMSGGFSLSADKLDDLEDRITKVVRGSCVTKRAIL